jgi:hypothetical protein
MEHTVALSTNPFDPDIDALPDVPPNLAEGLGGNALRVDLAPELKDLFCWKMAGLRELDNEVTNLLFGMDKQGNNVVRRPGIIVVEGSRGSGKTSFASHIRRRLIDAGPPGGGEWRQLVKAYPYDPEALREADCQLAALRRDLRIVAGASGSLLAMIDDLPKGGFPRLVETFEAFPDHFKVFLVTKEDDPSLGEETKWVRPRARLLKIPSLTSADVTEYVRHRVELFRRPDLPQFSNTSPLFPFEANYARKSVGQGTMPLRLINRRYGETLLNHHRTHDRPNFDVAGVAVGDLPDYLIRWAD